MVVKLYEAGLNAASGPVVFLWVYSLYNAQLKPYCLS